MRLSVFFGLRTSVFGLFLASVFGLSSCKKEKLDVPYRSDAEVKGLSAYRFINLGGYSDIRANGDSLTNFLPPLDLLNAPSIYYKFPGTAYFLKNGKLEKDWQVPSDVFSEDGRADMLFEALNNDGSIGNVMGLTLHNEGKPTDYYLLQPYFFPGKPYVAVDRSDVSPPQADHFKIRIINLSTLVHSAGNSRGVMEELAGPISLAYADGTPVDEKTSHLSQEKIVSDYVELPYGTYQFKLLTEDGRQIPNADGLAYQHTLIDPPTSSVPQSADVPTNIPFIPVQTYQPGGIYTIVVNPFVFKVIVSAFGTTELQYQNAFRIINDNSPGVNTTFTQVQAFNALPGQAVSFRLGDKPLADQLPYGQASPVSIEQAGTYKVEALNAAGEVLASLDYPLNARQNYTAWIYPDTQGKPQLAMEANDLSGNLFKGLSEEDATFDHTQMMMPFEKRFLNLSPDVPYLSYTLDNDQSIAGAGFNADAVYNLEPGEVPAVSPYTWSGIGPNPYQIMAYRSAPDVVPGIWASDIPVLSSQDLIARKASYTDAGRVLPPQEAGIFTVALIGRTGSDVPEAQKAKMVILKHNK